MATSVNGSMRRLSFVPPDILKGAPYQRGVRVILVYDLATQQVDVEYEIETFSASNPAPADFDGVIEPVFALPYVFEKRTKGGNVEGFRELPDLSQQELDSVVVELERHIEENVFALQRSRNAEGVSEERVSTAKFGTAARPIVLDSKNPAAGL